MGDFARYQIGQEDRASAERSPLQQAGSVQESLMLGGGRSPHRRARSRRAHRDRAGHRRGHLEVRPAHHHRDRSPDRRREPTDNDLVSIDGMPVKVGLAKSLGLVTFVRQED